MVRLALSDRRIRTNPTKFDETLTSNTSASGLGYKRFVKLGRICRTTRGLRTECVICRPQEDPKDKAAAKIALKLAKHLLS
jgi:hypothetical protein